MYYHRYITIDTYIYIYVNSHTVMNAPRIYYITVYTFICTMLCRLLDELVYENKMKGKALLDQLNCKIELEDLKVCTVLYCNSSIYHSCILESKLM